MKIKYLENSAVLIADQGKSLLVDGLFSNKQYFDPYDPGLEESILLKHGTFSHLTGLLFTHRHDDHFDQKLMRKYMDLYPEDVLFLPENVSLEGMDPEETHEAGLDLGSVEGVFAAPETPEEKAERERRAAALKHLHVPERGEIGDKGSFSEGSFNIEYVRTGHVSFDYPEHFCIKVSTESGSAILTGDMETDLYPQLPEWFDIDDETFVFFNAVPFGKEELLRQVTALPGRTVFYHIPEAGNDFFYYRAMVERAMSKHPRILKDSTILMHHMTKVI